MTESSHESWALNRRGYLKLATVGAVTAPLSMLADAAKAAPEISQRRRALRFAHLTDIHVQPELNAAKGLTTCLRHVQSLPNAVDMIVTGGDVLMDVFAVDNARSKMLSELWRGILKQECSLPIRPCIGNHDIRPWSKEGDGGLLGKAWTLDMYGLENRYYAFDQGGWRFLVLDSVQPSGRDYTSGIDAEQLAWLEQELQSLSNHRPVAIVSHIPLLSVATLTFGKARAADGAQQVPAYLLHVDGSAIHGLLREHPNVKVCLSGHLHLRDRCEIDGVTYICGGAVSANWWKGKHQKVEEGYGVVDLYDDGSFDYAYVPYGWHAVPA